MSECFSFDFYQSEDFAVPVRDYNKMLIVTEGRAANTIIDINKNSHFEFPKLIKIIAPFIENVLFEVSDFVTLIEGKGFRPVIVAPSNSLGSTITFDKKNACWTSTIAIVGLQ